MIELFLNKLKNEMTKILRYIFSWSCLFQFAFIYFAIFLEREYLHIEGSFNLMLYGFVSFNLAFALFDDVKIKVRKH